MVNMKKLKEFKVIQGHIRCMSKLDTGYYAVGTNNGKIHIFKDFSLLLKKDKAHDDDLLTLTYDSEKDHLLSAARDRKVKVWDYKTKSTLVCLHVIELNRDVISICFINHCNFVTL